VLLYIFLKLEANATVFTESGQEFTRAIKSSCVRNSRKETLPLKLSGLNLKLKFAEPISNTQVSLRDAEILLKLSTYLSCSNRRSSVCISSQLALRSSQNCLNSCKIVRRISASAVIIAASS